MGNVSSSGPGDDRSMWPVVARDDPEAFGAFYRSTHSRVTRYFYVRTMCAQTSAELTAETYARLWAFRRRFNPDLGTPVAWTFGIAGNLHRQFLDRGRVSKRLVRRLGMSLPVPDEAAVERIEQLVDLEPMAASLREAVAALSPRVRDAVMLRVALDLPYSEVAKRLGCTAGTARVRVSRGLHLLQVKLEAVS